MPLPRHRLTICFGLLAGLCASAISAAQDRVQGLVVPSPREIVVGPYAAHIAAGGPALLRPMPPQSEVLRDDGEYTLVIWERADAATAATTTLYAGLGDPAGEHGRFLGVVSGRPVFRLGPGNVLTAPTALAGSGWHMLAASVDGNATRLFVDGVQVAEGALSRASVAPELRLAPVFHRLASAADDELTPVYEVPFAHFGGDLAGTQVIPHAMGAAEMHALYATPPDEALLRWDENARPWPVQVREQAGYAEPQDPSTMPVSRAPYSQPRAQTPPPLVAGGLVAVDDTTWSLNSNWYLLPAPQTTQQASALASPGVNVNGWMRATVPGTVLTTMIDRGLYPDPDYGLNNLAIPESLARQAYWYRTEFKTPADAKGHTFALDFEGINYAAEVWLNGERLGDVRGAFVRGQFDVSTDLRPNGETDVLAVRISPPPHPGIPQEQSLVAGPGENGGAMCLDGPTFVATEGWDWIPAIRDRNSGLWQGVSLHRTDTLRLGDPQVITELPLPDTSSATVRLNIPVRNLGSAPVEATLHVRFEGVEISHHVTLPAGDSTVRLTPAEEPSLRLNAPRLWWPNGYGKPELYHLQLTLDAGSTPSDHRVLTFGVREVTYELSLFDSAGKLRRVEVDPAVAAEHGEQVVDVSHAGMRNTAEYWAASLTTAGEHSTAVRPVAGEEGFTDLVLKVNGVRIAARGGNWGMDDSRKRVSREHLEPYFRLQREANLNIIRNWVGQDTEETFYQLADEYGMMVWNDFWESTQDYNVEADDVPLFVENARDVVRRFRNHPSIVIWCGRNEGVPQPALNRALIDVFRDEDGTRYYTPGSNRINLRNSGPYKYQDPKLYYSTLDRGFSVELGIASLSTREALEASIAPADRWPISDAWAYHDWHASGNGDTHPLVDAIDTQLGAATSFPDFERKAQMFNYVDHRAIFEGFNQHLWSPNSGRMLWMTHPAWPSNMWQIYSSDYDTQASYYGVKKACEPLHLQLDLSTHALAAVNTTPMAAAGLTAHTAVYSLAGALLSEHDDAFDLPADAVHPLPAVNLGTAFALGSVALVELTLHDHAGKELSRNVYWLAAKDSEFRQLNQLTAATLQVHATDAPERAADGERSWRVTLTNTGHTPALAVKLTLLNAKSHQRVLPAYWSDNYVSLMPGETLTLGVQAPGASQATAIALRGWNLIESQVNTGR